MRIPLPGNFGKAIGQRLKSASDLAQKRQQLAQQKAYQDAQLALKKQLLQGQLERIHTQDLADQQKIKEGQLFRQLLGGGSPGQSSSPNQATVGSQGRVPQPGMGEGMYSPAMLSGKQAETQQTPGLQPTQAQTGENKKPIYETPGYQRAQILGSLIGEHLPSPTELQTPQQKLQMQAQLSKQRAVARAKARGGTTPTTTTAGAAQKTIQSTKNVLPLLNELIQGKHAYGIFDISPDKKADYNAATGRLIDQLLAIYNLPKTEASQKLLEDQVRRQRGELYSHYENRLRQLRDDVLHRYSVAADAIGHQKVDIADPEHPEKEALPQDISQMSNEQLEKIARGET